MQIEDETLVDKIYMEVHGKSTSEELYTVLLVYLQL